MYNLAIANRSGLLVWDNNITPDCVMKCFNKTQFTDFKQDKLLGY